MGAAIGRIACHADPPIMPSWSLALPGGAVSGLSDPCSLSIPIPIWISTCGASLFRCSAAESEGLAQSQAFTVHAQERASCRSGFALAARGAFHRLGRDIPAASSITEHDSPHPEPRIPPPAVSPCQPYSPFVFFVPFVVSQRMNNPALQHQFHPAHPASRPPIPEGLSPATPGDTRPFGRVNYFLVGGIVFVENADIYASMRRS
jgi:hypothetical protein